MGVAVKCAALWPYPLIPDYGIPSSREPVIYCWVLTTPCSFPVRNEPACHRTDDLCRNGRHGMVRITPSLCTEDWRKT